MCCGFFGFLNTVYAGDKGLALVVVVDRLVCELLLLTSDAKPDNANKDDALNSAPTPDVGSGISVALGLPVLPYEVKEGWRCCFT